MIVRVIPPDGDPNNDASLWKMTFADFVYLNDAAGAVVCAWSWDEAVSRFKPSGYWGLKRDLIFKVGDGQELRIHRKDIGTVNCEMEVFHHLVNPDRARRRLWQGLGIAVVGLTLWTFVDVANGPNPVEDPKLGFWIRLIGVVLTLIGIVCGLLDVLMYLLLKRIARKEKIAGEPKPTGAG